MTPSPYMQKPTTAMMPRTMAAVPSPLAGAGPQGGWPRVAGVSRVAVAPKARRARTGSRTRPGAAGAGYRR